MNILMVLDEEFPPDGRVEREIHILQKAGHTLHLLCYSLSQKSGLEKVGGIDVFYVPISKADYKFKALALLLPFYFRFWTKNLRKQLKKFSYDVIHFHDLNLAKVCIQEGEKFRIKVIGDYHENRPEIMKLYDHVRTFPGSVLISTQKWYKFQIRYSILLDHLILVTKEAKDYYIQHYGIRKEIITVIENFPELDQLLALPVDRSIVDKYEKKRMIVYFGDTGLRRGTGTIMEAANLLKQNSLYHFVIIGTSREQEKLVSLKEKYGLKNIELTGEMPIEKAVSYFKAANVGVCPFLRNIHHDTTYANKLFQYMAFAKPVVVSNCTSQVNVINESDCGLVHEAGNASDMVEKILTLENPEVYAQMGKNAIEAVKLKYNFDVSKQKLVNLYNKLSDEIKRNQ